jgi:hypothetical protein
MFQLHVNIGAIFPQCILPEKEQIALNFVCKFLNYSQMKFNVFSELAKISYNYKNV